MPQDIIDKQGLHRVLSGCRASRRELEEIARDEAAAPKSLPQEEPE